MKIRFLLLLILATLAIGFFSYKVTHALFSDAAQSNDNTFSAAQVFPHLVINEVSSDGNPNLEWVEIYNPTASSVDVSGWLIEDGNSSDTFPTITPIPAGGYAVVIGNASTVSVPPSAITITLGSANIGSGLNDMGDLVRLKTPTSVIVDAMNYGDITTIFPTPPAAPGSGQSVARILNGVDTNTASDWAIDTSPSIGVAN